MPARFPRLAAVCCLAGACTLAAGFPAAAAPGKPGWRIADVIRGADVNRVAATGPRDAWAVGGVSRNGMNPRPLVLHWNGRSWRAAALPAGFGGGTIAEMGAVGASSASNAWAFGAGDFQAILHWNGHSWSKVHDPLSGVVSGTAVIGPGDVWAFGCPGVSDGAGTWHFNGRRWMQYRLPFGETCGGAARTGSDIWAWGFKTPGDGGFFVHWDGTRWHLVRTPAVRLPDGRLHRFDVGTVQPLPGSEVWALGIASATIRGKLVSFPVALRWNGRRWRQIAVPGSGIDLIAASADGAGGLWVTPVSVTKFRNLGYVLHETGGRWFRVTLPRLPGSTGRLSYALVPHSTTVWAAESNAILRHGR